MIPNLPQVEELRALLHHEGWQPHPALPWDWRLKKRETKAVVVITREGAMLGLGKALKYMASRSNEYNQSDLERLNSLHYELVKEERDVRSVWREDPSLPGGWRMRPGVRAGGEQLISPQGFKVMGRLEAILLLLRAGRAPRDREVLCFRSGLHLQGWQQADTLPEGWLLKVTRKRETSILQGKDTTKFLSPTYQVITGLPRVFHHLQKQKCHTNVLSAIRDQLQLKGVLTDRKNRFKKFKGKPLKWVVEAGLPPGWRVGTRHYKYGVTKEVFLSPSGLALDQAVLAWQLMLEEGARPDHLGSFLPRLEAEGWRMHPSLPEGWRISLNPQAMPGVVDIREEDEPKVLFLTSRAQVLTFYPAMEVLREQEGYTLENVAGFRDLIAYLQQELTIPGGWMEDPDLPEGWRLATQDMGYKVKLAVRSAEGMEFDSVLDGFLALAAGGRSRKDLPGMRRLLVKEGWEEGQSLPEGWLVARSRGDDLFQLLSREGKLFRSLFEAQAWMEREGEVAYPEAAVLGLEELCMALVREYLTTRPTTEIYK